MHCVFEGRGCKRACQGGCQRGCARQSTPGWICLSGCRHWQTRYVERARAPKSASRRPAHTRGQSPRGRVEEGGGGCTARLEGGPRRDLRHGLSRIDVKVAAPVFGRDLQPPPPSLGSMRRQPHTAAPRRPGHPRARRPAGGPCTRRAAPTAPARAAPGHS